MGKTIGIIAIKGGVGKTTTTLNLGAVIAKEFNKKVLMVDANFSAPNLGLHLGMVNPEGTIHDVLLKRAALGDVIHEYEPNLHIIPGALLGKKINPFLLKEKMKSIKNEYDFILIDSSPSLNEEMLSTMIASEQLLVVTSPDYPTLSMTMRAVRLAKQKKTPITGLVLNKVRNKNFELTIEDIEEAAEAPVIALLKDDVALLEALSNTKPIAEYSPNKDIVYEYRKLAAAVIGEKYEDKRIITKIKNIFSREPSKVDTNRSQLTKLP